MKHSTKKPTKAEAARLAQLSNMPCVACMLGGKVQFQRCEIHHLLSGGRRRGHAATVPLCAWHHRGEPAQYTARYMTAVYGPSLARAPKLFRATYGTDDKLLEAVNRKLDAP